MQSKGLIFIPDISGFSRFVTETEIDHSRQIIQELLETLINANDTGLEISEIEGDAILFYRFGDPPDLREVSGQVERMFRAFHSTLFAYDLRKYCHCQACVGALSLTLKVITHYGEFTGYSVKSFNKLIGRDVIVAHELLKNDIEQHEYWLVTRSLLEAPPSGAIAAWSEWSPGSKQTQAGPVEFHYTLLTGLKAGAVAPALPQADLTGRFLAASRSREYATNIITLFHAAGDLSYRARWWEGVVRVEQVDHHLPRVGMECCCVMEDGASVTTRSNSYRYRADRIEFTETQEGRDAVTRFLLEAVDDGRSRLTLEHYLPDGLVHRLRHRLFGAEPVARSLERSLARLEPLAAEILVSECAPAHPSPA